MRGKPRRVTEADIIVLAAALTLADCLEEFGPTDERTQAARETMERVALQYKAGRKLRN